MYVVKTYAQVMLLRRYHPPAKNWWNNVRAAVFERDGWKCTKCSETRQLVCHHIRYDNLFFEDKHLQDLVTLCKRHHRIAHNIPWWKR